MTLLTPTSGVDHQATALSGLPEDDGPGGEAVASGSGTHLDGTTASGVPIDTDGGGVPDGTAGGEGSVWTSVLAPNPEASSGSPFEASATTDAAPQLVQLADGRVIALPPDAVLLDGAGAAGGTGGDGEVAASAPEPDLTLDDAPSSSLSVEQRAALETRGREFVDRLEAQEDDGLGGGRAEELRRNPALLEQIGALLGHEDAALGERAASVLIGGVNNTTKGGADGHVSALVRSGELDLRTFTALADDLDFLLTTDWLLHGPATRDGGLGAIDLYIDRASANIAEGKDPMDNTAQVYESRDGLLFHIPDAPREKGNGTRNEALPIHVNAEGKPLPQEMQEALAGQASTPEGIDPQTLAEARLLTDPRGAGAGEQLAAFSYQNGLTDLATLRGQLSEPTFLQSNDTARAAEVLFAPDPSPGEAFVGTLYRDGYIDTDTFIDYAKDTTFLADTEAALATGEATFTSPNNTDLDTLIDGMTDEDVKGLLGPGFDVANGPSGEQLAALYKVAGRSDQDFTELAVAWATEHNPGLELHYGYAENVHGDTPRGWLWRMDGEVIEDPFLDSLVQDFTFEDDSPVDKAFHKARRNADDDGEEMPPSIPVQVHMEGVSGNEWREGDFDDSRWKDAEETSAETDRVFSLVFPDKSVEEVLDRQNGYSVHYDDNNGTENGNDGQDGKARAAIDLVAPDLLGWEVTVARGGDGLEIVNSTRLGATGVIADGTDLDLDVSENGGPLNVRLSNYEDKDVSIVQGSGEENTDLYGSGEGEVTELFIPDDADVAFEDDFLADPFTSTLSRGNSVSTDAERPTIS